MLTFLAVFSREVPIVLPRFCIRCSSVSSFDNTPSSTVSALESSVSCIDRA